MKKMIYQIPEVKVKVLLVEENLMRVSGDIDEKPGIGWGGEGSEGMEGEAKEDIVTPHSVWDD